MAEETSQAQARNGWRWSSGIVVFIAGSAIVALMTFSMAMSGRQVTFGSQNVTFVDDGASTRALAQRAIDLKVIDQIQEAELRQIVDRLRAKAADGDPRAAMFVFEVARLQQAAAAQDKK